MHIAFGKGVRYSLEAEIALYTLLRHLPIPCLAVAPEHLKYQLCPLFHTYTRIPVC